MGIPSKEEISASDDWKKAYWKQLATMFPGINPCLPQRASLIIIHFNAKSRGKSRGLV
jgi:hypothetical protein